MSNGNTETMEIRYPGKENQVHKWRQEMDTGSNKIIPGAGKENYFETMAILLRKSIS